MPESGQIQQVVTTPAIEQHLHDCDWPAQRQLINYKLDTIQGQTSALNGRLDTVISNQAMAAGTDKYKKNIIPNVIQIGMFLVSCTALIISLLVVYTRRGAP